MACSEARTLANRENAQHSTGPRTEAGKCQSRRNALRHGLASTGIVLLPEDEAKLATRRASWVEVLRPADDVEAFLVERAVVHSVKLERASAVESVSAVASVERADGEYEAEVLGRLEAAETEARAWTRLGEELARFGTIGRDGFESFCRLLNVGGSEDPRRYDIFALTRMAGSNEARHEAARPEAREALGNLIGARLEERRRMVARIFEEIDGPEGRALARAKAAINPDPAGTLARRYEEADERGLLRMLDQLDRRRKATAKSSQSPELAHPGRRPDDSGNLVKLPNEPNGVRSAERTSGPGKLGKLPNEPNGTDATESAASPGHLGRLPNEPNTLSAPARVRDLGNQDRLPNEPNAAQESNGSGGFNPPGHSGDLEGVVAIETKTGA